MSADEYRERIEAAAWRAGLPADAVDAILADADAYAGAVLGERLDHVERARRQADRRAVLAEAVKR